MSYSASQSEILRNDSSVSFIKNADGGMMSSPLSEFISTEETTGMVLKSGWAGGVPRPLQRTGTAEATGGVVHRRINFYEHTVTPVLWDNTIDVDASTYADATGKTNITGLINLAGRIGTVNGIHTLFRAQQVLMLGNGTTVGTTYAGGAFFANSHEAGATLDNLRSTDIATSNNPTVAEFEAAVAGCIEDGTGFTDDQGKVYDHDETNFVFMVPRSMALVASKVLNPNGTMTGKPASTMGVATDSSQTSGAFRTYEWFINGDMSDQDRFVALRRPRNGNVGPLVLNMRERPDLIVLDRYSPSDYAISNDVVWFTTKGRWDLGYGDPRSAILQIFT